MHSQASTPKRMPLVMAAALSALALGLLFALPDDGRAGNPGPDSVAKQQGAPERIGMIASPRQATDRPAHQFSPRLGRMPSP